MPDNKRGSKKTAEDLAFNAVVGRNIKYLRKYKKLNQTQVATGVKVKFQQLQKYEKGFNIYMNDIRYKMITDDYNYLFNLKPNHNNKLFTFLTLYKQRNLNEYCKYFPDDKEIFDKYKNKYEIMRNELYSNYCNHFIKKDIVTKDVPYQLKPLIFE